MLDKHRDEFKRVVLAHMSEVLCDEQWLSFRVMSMRSNGTVGPATSIGASISHEALFNKHSSIDSISVRDILATRVGASACAIAFIEEAPVYFLEIAGIYLWGPTDSKFSYSLWLTAPAYPPGW